MSRQWGTLIRSTVAALAAGWGGPACPEDGGFRVPPLTLTNAAYLVERPPRIGLNVVGDPDSAPVIERAVTLAAQLVREESYRDALRLLDAVLLQHPDEARALVMKSAALTKTHRYREALAVLDRLAELQPDSFAMKNNAAWIYATATDAALRDGGRAVELAKEALVLAPGSYQVWSTVSEGYYASGDFEQALAFAEEAHRMAMLAGASSTDLREYRDQIRKNEAALHAFRLIE